MKIIYGYQPLFLSFTGAPPDGNIGVEHLDSISCSIPLNYLSGPGQACFENLAIEITEEGNLRPKSRRIVKKKKKEQFFVRKMEHIYNYPVQRNEILTFGKIISVI